MTRDDFLMRNLLKYGSGLGVLDRDLQLHVLQQANQEADRQYRTQVELNMMYNRIDEILANAGVPRDLWGIVHFHASGLAKCYARRSGCSTSGLTKLTEIGIPANAIEAIIKEAKYTGDRLAVVM